MRVPSVALLFVMQSQGYFAAVLPPRSAVALQMKQENTMQAMWFSQKLDHFNPKDSRTFDQKYYYNDAHFRDPSGPVFLYISGEAPLYGAPHQGSLVDDLAEETGALVIALEHRYYGESLPFTLLDLENLSYLNSGQALMDIAAFRVYFQNVIRNRYSSRENRWFTFGGSYAGALAAWFRQKFPQLTRGSLASSGVVHSVTSFPEFDLQVAKTVGFECAELLRRAHEAVDGMLASSDQNRLLKRMFEASVLSDGDFRFMLGDAVSMAVQYGYKNLICEPFVNARKLGISPVKALANYTVSFFYPTLEQGGAKEYSVQYLGTERIDPEMTGRQWRYQQCSELGWFQNAPSHDNIRSQLLNDAYQRVACNKIFGNQVWPDTDAVNRNYGGKHLKVSNVFFTNGVEDPWQHVSIVQSSNPSMPARLVDCETCSHCVDLKHISDDDPQELKDVREDIKYHVKMWLTQP